MPRRPALTTVARRGDTLATLEATRNAITTDIDNCTSMRDKAALYGRLRDILDRIHELRQPEAKGDIVDEITQRRTARRAGPAADSSRTTRTG